MKKGLIRILCLLYLSLSTAYAQDDMYDVLTKEDFIYLYNDDFLREGEFTRENNFLFRRKFVDLEGDEIERIKFYQYENDYFGSYNGSYGKRVETGFFDLFEGYSTVGVGGNTSTSKYYLYSRNFDGLQRLKYNTLREDFIKHGDNIEPFELDLVLGELEDGRRLSKIKWGIVAAGVGTFMIGGALSNKYEDDPLKSRNFLIVGIAGIGITIGSLFSGKSEKKYRKGLRDFNRFYYRR